MRAPELIVAKWLNSDQPLSIEKLKGRVIAVHAFQMLCPGCVIHGIPQAQRLFELFDPTYLSVIGLHTVFEHHAGMQEQSLKAFLHEFRIQFPVAIDQPSKSTNIPETMKIYLMQGTPTWIIIDKNGELRDHFFGQVDDLVLGAEVAKLIHENLPTETRIFNERIK